MTIHTPKLFFTIFLGAIVFATSTLAVFTEPTSSYPNNSAEPIDIGADDQAKTGALSVYQFTARGDADFSKTAVVGINGVVQNINAGDPLTTPSIVTVGTSALVDGQLRATSFLNSEKLRHAEAAPKPVCGDINGNVVFCTPTTVAPRISAINAVERVDNNFSCSVTLDAPARTGGETATLRVEIIDLNGDKTYALCTVPINEGDTNGYVAKAGPQKPAQSQFGGACVANTSTGVVNGLGC